ncbi:MAG TPA: PTS sugar transporter subunit IIA [Thermoanaerobaculia bacterium]|nr:PTS sugar transporter subunit IIA [Thermoanaerobaculia bacterium]
MRLDSLTNPELIFPELDADDREAVLRAMSDRLEQRRVIESSKELYDRLLEREQLGSTGVGAGVAIPHCKLKELSKVVLAIGITRQGVDFGAIDAKPVRLFFLVVSPTDAPAVHLQVLAAISRWLKEDSHASRVLELRDRQAIYGLLEEGG